MKNWLRTLKRISKRGSWTEEFKENVKTGIWGYWEKKVEICYIN